jgi:hypothetical protein
MSPPHVKDWLKREEILSLSNRQPSSSIDTAAIQFGWCFCFVRPSARLIFSHWPLPDPKDTGFLE